jgi:hypothetical protein
MLVDIAIQVGNRNALAFGRSAFGDRGVSHDRQADLVATRGVVELPATRLAGVPLVDPRHVVGLGQTSACPIVDVMVVHHVLQMRRVVFNGHRFLVFFLVGVEVISQMA